MSLLMLIVELTLSSILSPDPVGFEASLFIIEISSFAIHQMLNVNVFWLYWAKLHNNTQNGVGLHVLLCLGSMRMNVS